MELASSLVSQLARFGKRPKWKPPTRPRGSQRPRPLDAIEKAFNSVWRTLYAHVTSDNRQSEELKIQLSRTLVALASDGITDPRELRRKALESMAFSIG